jgi:hypothetical protein
MVLVRVCPTFAVRRGMGPRDLVVAGAVTRDLGADRSACPDDMAGARVGVLAMVRSAMVLHYPSCLVRAEAFPSGLNGSDRAPWRVVVVGRTAVRVGVVMR